MEVGHHQWSRGGLHHKGSTTHNQWISLVHQHVIIVCFNAEGGSGASRRIGQAIQSNSDTASGILTVGGYHICLPHQHH